MTAKCKISFFKDISAKDQISEQLFNQISNDQEDLNELIKNEIIQCAIKKVQYRTIKMRQELLPYYFNSKNDNTYKFEDFFLIQSQDFNLYYNFKDQILNVLKFYEDEKRFKHEIDFYNQIENTFPFIRKILGLIKRSYGLPIIVLEYVEGERLDKFILSEKEIGFNTKIKIIEEILFSVYYVHSNGFYLRDLKPDNIIIDSKKDAILIDFDSSKKMYSSNDDAENTCNIGNPVFTAPEQFKSNEYSYKVDSYSCGMIIHFIITKQKFEFIDYDLFEIHKQKENILKNDKFPRCPKVYEFILNIYEKCFEISPSSRPSIVTLIEKIINDDIKQLKCANEAELPYIINQLEKYESIFKIADKYMHEESLELSYIQLFLGFIYYSGKYISCNINKAIIQLEKSSNRNNSEAQYFLGRIYYLGEYISRDINKSIHYLILSANQNNSDAQCYLGYIYYVGEYILCDINKSIYYLTLSANQNNSDAQYYLGEIYYESDLVSQNIDKSIHYLTLSANQNDSDAQCYLGYIYYLGDYISRDINKSIHYLTLSANQNNSYAQYLLGIVYYKGELISQNINKSIYYLTYSSNNNNNLNAQFYLGYIYYIGEYIPRDINKSIHYLTLSSNQNDSDAQCLLGEIFYNGKYIEKNIIKAIHYFKESSCFYDSIAKNYLGIIYKNGDGVEKNIYFAKTYFKEAIRQKEQSYSMYNLARIYYFGIDVKRKIAKAIELLKQASNKQLLIADLFLFYIFSNCDDKNFMNQTKSHQYYKKCQKNFSSQMRFINFDNYESIQKLHIFLRDYDLMRCYNYSNDLLYFLINGKFYDWKIENCEQENNISLRKDINTDFYEGFYD